MPGEVDKREIYFGDLEFISNFVNADRTSQRPGRGQMWVGMQNRHNRKRLLDALS